jgi:hypothetical protein
VSGLQYRVGLGTRVLFNDRYGFDLAHAFWPFEGSRVRFL